ncbi:C-3',4' desaturase CrtD [Metabacillus crassostreae]|uniref:FAD-dependent oxidoreductase n=1 Tax=Metabacillus crassostreae TaxID=929098 RepID=UPI001EF85D9F|nr:FAD-dependent oxidoreductase [Metabacillus crassostreae]MBM7605000.1 C-3',4' desaturase CrtD [Metabacillus crassostreae]
MIVIGGGIGGLTAAAFLAKDGFNVTVLEASNEWGGCAGKFARGQYLFPVGATLGMGFEEDGVHSLLFKELGIAAPSHFLLPTVMDIHFPNKTVHYYKDRSLFLEELKKHFPHLDRKLQPFYEEIWKIGAEVKKLMVKLPVLPAKTMSEWLLLIKSIRLQSVILLPYLNQTFSSLLEKHNLTEEKEFVALLDSQLIDSMQTTSYNCSAIIGAFALTIYHEGAFYLEGGLFEIAHSLTKVIEDHGGKLIKRAKVTSITKQNLKYEVVDQRNRSWSADHVICNLPIPNLVQLLEPSLLKNLSNSYQRKTDASHWGTMTLYLAIKEEVIPNDTPLFQQVLQGKIHEMSEGNHLFLSLSRYGDTKRSPAGTRTLTVSTHTNLDLWRSKEHYDQYKETLSKKMIEGVKKAFPSIEEGMIHFIEGAPRAWERFTGRQQGMVGGFAQTKENALFNSLSHRTGIPNLWTCGDSVFPGAGTISVSISGYHVYRSIKAQIKRP